MNEKRERIDKIGFGELLLIQDPQEFCYGVDAVLLADFAAKGAKLNKTSGDMGVTAVDLGTGTGIIPLILSYKTSWNCLIGVEVQEGSWNKACRNIKLNSEFLKERVSFIHGDVKEIGEKWGENILGHADVVTCNPPYNPNSGGIASSNPAKSIARHESTAGLEEFIICASKLLKSKGDFFLVHRPSRLVDICCMGRKHRLEPKEMCFVSPREGEPANIILVHLVKDGGRQMKLLPAINIYNHDGTYTETVRESYR